MRASFGAIRIAWSIMPGTPTASKITERADSVRLAPRVDGRRDSRVDDYVGAELLGERAPLAGEVGGDDRADAAHLQLGDARQTDRAAAEHDRALVAGDAALGDGVHADGQRLGQRRDVGSRARRGP